MINAGFCNQHSCSHLIIFRKHIRRVLDKRITVLLEIKRDARLPETEMILLRSQTGRRVARATKGKGERLRPFACEILNTAIFSPRESSKSDIKFHTPAYEKFQCSLPYEVRRQYQPRIQTVQLVYETCQTSFLVQFPVDG